jgi:purine-nucleoside phosphorylase
LTDIALELQGVWSGISGYSWRRSLIGDQKFQIIGGSAVGMSTAPETILARRFGLKVAALSVITNLAAGIEGASPSHDETKREGAKAAENMKALVTRFMKDA